MLPLISLIIPVYNVALYLERCLKSIEIVFSLGCEVIIVNDGSTDSSQEIIDSYVRQHPSVISIFQKNKGLSAARNTGLKYATGEYIWFIDSDDFINSIEFYRIIDDFKYKNIFPDIIVLGRVEEFSSYAMKVPRHIIKCDFISGQDYFMKSINNGSFRTNVWDKLFKKSLIDHYQIRFVEGLLYEDMFFCLNAFMFAENISVFPYYPYHYIHYNNASITKQVRKKDLDVLRFIQQAFNFINRGNFAFNVSSKEFQLLIFMWVSSCLMNKYAYLSFFDEEAKFVVQEVLNDEIFMNSVKYCSRNKVGFRHIFFAKLLLFSPTIYKVVLHGALKIQRIKFKYLS